MKTGLYEELISKTILDKLKALNEASYFIKRTSINQVEAARILALYLSTIIQKALGSYTKENALESQITLTNNLIKFIRDQRQEEDDFNEDLVSTEAKILSAIFAKDTASFADLDLHLKEITPETSL